MKNEAAIREKRKESQKAQKAKNEGSDQRRRGSERQQREEESDRGVECHPAPTLLCIRASAEGLALLV